MIRTVEDIIQMHWRAIPNISQRRWAIVASDDDGNDVAWIALDLPREVAEHIIQLHNQKPGL